MEFFLHYSQRNLDLQRMETHNVTARNAALEGQLRTTRLARTRLSKKVEALQEANVVLRGRLKTAREDLATRDATIEELEEDNSELHRENEDLLLDDDVPSDGMDMSDPSDQEDDDARESEEDPEEILFDGDDGGDD